MTHSARLIALIWTVGLAGCSPSTTTSEASYAVFGTTVSVTVRHAQDSEPSAALAELDYLFQRLHRDWHPWEPGALTRLNDGLSSGEWVEIPADIEALLARSQRLETASGGRFNAAIGRLVALWGFHTSNYPITTPPPSDPAVDALLAQQPSSLDIEWSEQRDVTRVRTDNASVGLDFSGVAKGAAAELSCALLEEAGFVDALVNLGGDVMVCGPAVVPWRVAINHPQSGVLEVLAVDQRLAVFTSGQYHRYGIWDGERYAHVLDPATGRPVKHLVQATAIDPDPVLADAAATALVVAGLDSADHLGEQLGLARWRVVDATPKRQSEASHDAGN